MHGTFNKHTVTFIKLSCDLLLNVTQLISSLSVSLSLSAAQTKCLSKSAPLTANIKDTLLSSQNGHKDSGGGICDHHYHYQSTKIESLHCSLKAEGSHYSNPLWSKHCSKSNQKKPLKEKIALN